MKTVMLSEGAYGLEERRRLRNEIQTEAFNEWILTQPDVGLVVLLETLYIISRWADGTGAHPAFRQLRALSRQTIEDYRSWETLAGVKPAILHEDVEEKEKPLQPRLFA